MWWQALSDAYHSVIQPSLTVTVTVEYETRCFYWYILKCKNCESTTNTQTQPENFREILQIFKKISRISRSVRHPVNGAVWYLLSLTCINVIRSLCNNLIPSITCLLPVTVIWAVLTGVLGRRLSELFIKNLWKSPTYEKLRMSMWLSKNLMKNLGQSYAKLMKNLRRRYRCFTKI